MPHDMRVGQGWDLHRLEPAGGSESAQPLIIGGIEVSTEFRVVAHSDGDVLFHAITDAILGALALPDIGELFPPEDDRWKGTNSAVFLREAMSRARAAGWVVENLDATVILQEPKLREFKGRVRENLAGVLGLDVGDVNVKGKSHERVDAVGESRAIEAHAVVLLSRRRSS